MALRNLVFFVICCAFVFFLLLNTSLTGFNIKRGDVNYEASLKQRLHFIRKGCKELKSRHFYSPSKFYADDKHKLLYCYVPKVACTNLKKIMLVLNGLISTNNFTSIPRDFIHENNPLKRAEAYADGELFKRGFGSYLKFMFVRHPFERLVSAYHDKFAGNSSVYRMNIGREIVQRYRHDKESLDVTFPEFVSYVIDEWKAGRRKLDVHWRPMTDLCHPCSIKYDFIGKFETFRKDLKYLLNKTNETKATKLMFLDQHGKPATSTKLVRDSFNLLTKQQIDDLILIYDSDFKIFNYY